MNRASHSMGQEIRDFGFAGQVINSRDRDVYQTGAKPPASTTCCVLSNNFLRF